jgi:hypothetical protein
MNNKNLNFLEKLQATQIIYPKFTHTHTNKET